jgi:hypothetical protein
MQVAKALFAGASVVLVAGVAPGCGATAAGYCSKRCDCVPCTADQKALCVTQVDDSRASSQASGCGSQFDAYFSCLDSETACVAGAIDEDGCEVERDALVECGGFLGNVCDKFVADLNAKYAECGITGSGGGTGSGECTPAQSQVDACYDACLPKLDCPCLVNPSGAGCGDKLNVYGNCVSACQ